MDQLPRSIGAWVERTVSSTIHVLSYVPGSAVIGRYIEASHQNDPARTVFEILLFFFAVHYFLASKQPYNKTQVTLSDTEIDALVAEWKPDPLVPELDSASSEIIDEIPVLQGANGAVVSVEGRDRPLLNFTSTDIYGFSSDPKIQDVGIEAVRYYGVGSCGPAGFYGNQVAHIDAEKAIAEFLGAERSIYYAQGLATATSVLPCFAKRSDVLVVDSLVNMSIQKGVQLSRARVYWFKHNDMEDLERQLQRANAAHRKGAPPRRLIVTEGLFEYTGQSPDLPRLIELKKRFKYRLLLDESWSLGVLGPRGRGLPDEYGVPRSEIDITVGTLASAIGSSGGFCAGKDYMVQHQRIVSLAYTFSATCPPYLACCTKAVMQRMDTPEFVHKDLEAVRAKATALYDILLKCSKLDLISRRGVPIIIFKCSAHEDDQEVAIDRDLGAIVMGCRDRDILISRLRQISGFEIYPHLHAIRLYVPNGLSMDQIKAAGKTMVSVINKTLPQKKHHKY